MCKLVTFGVLCALAVLVSAASVTERRCLMASALVIAGNWLLFSMPWIYAPASFEFVMSGWGLPGTQEDGWAILDLCSLVAIVGCCWRSWWGPLLWSPYLVTLSMHAVAYSSHLKYGEYQGVLDASLAVQLAVIFLIGGPEVANRVLDRWRDIRGVGVSAGAQRKASS